MSLHGTRHAHATPQWPTRECAQTQGFFYLVSEHEALLHGKPSSAATLGDTCRAHGHGKKNMLYLPSSLYRSWSPATTDRAVGARPAVQWPAVTTQ